MGKASSLAACLGAAVVLALSAAAGATILEDFEAYNVGDPLQGKSGGSGWAAGSSWTSNATIQNMTDGSKSARVTANSDAALSRFFDPKTAVVYLSAVLRLENWSDNDFLHSRRESDGPALRCARRFARRARIQNRPLQDRNPGPADKIQHSFLSTPFPTGG